MGWRPSSLSVAQRRSSNPYWVAIAHLFQTAAFIDPLPRRDLERLHTDYVRLRRDDTPFLEAIRSRLPAHLERLQPGPSDIKLIDFLLRFSQRRVLRLTGPRGAGKTSMIHFAEAALAQSDLEHPLVLVIVNGAHLSGATTHRDLIDIIAGKFARRAKDGPHAQAFAAAAAVIGTDFTLRALAAACRALAEGLPNRDCRLVTFVFDNLDQLDSPIIELAAETAGIINSVSDLGCILCMRQGTRATLIRSSSARALFYHELPVSSPALDPWLENVADRLERAATVHPTRPVVDGVELSPEQLRESINRFRTLLLGRRPADSVMHILDAVSADDLRHANLLVRRMLAAPQLPYRWMLGQTSEYPDFHPLTALILSDARYFLGDDLVPNLLSFEDTPGNPEFLLAQRVLKSLATQRDAVRVDDLFGWMSQLGYEQPIVDDCLKRLLTSQLVRATDAEILADNQPLPGFVFITDAGQYYLEQLLRRADYVSAAVMDVPLEHRVLRDQMDRGAEESFAARIDSMIEYCEEVKKREARQVALLAHAQPAPILRRVADTLRLDGLLTHSLNSALKELAERSRKTTARDVYAQVARLDEVIRKNDLWIADTSKRLEESINRGRKARALPQRPVITGSRTSMQIELALTRLGDDVRLSTVVRSPRSMLSAVVSVSIDTASGPFVQTVPLTREQSSEALARQSGAVLRGVFSEVEESTLPVAIDEQSVCALGVREGVSAWLLTIDETQGRTSVRLSRTGGGRCDYHVLGEGIETSAIEKWAETEFRSLGDVPVSSVRFQEELRRLGTELSLKTLSESGCEVLAGLQRELREVILVARDPRIPWELLNVPATVAPGLDCLGATASVIRWPAHTRQISYWTQRSETPIGMLRTIGLGNGPAWRFATPASMSDLKRDATCDTLHLVGHWMSDRLKWKDSEAFLLRASDLRASGIDGPRAVVLSACDASTCTSDISLPVALSEVCGCEVWAPMCKVTVPDVEALDSALQVWAAANQHGSLVSFFRANRQQIPVTNLFVRYGSGRPTPRGEARGGPRTTERPALAKS